jgi:hypothetical protein
MKILGIVWAGDSDEIQKWGKFILAVELSFYTTHVLYFLFSMISNRSQILWKSESQNENYYFNPRSQKVRKYTKIQNNMPTRGNSPAGKFNVIHSLKIIVLFSCFLL